MAATNTKLRTDILDAALLLLRDEGERAMTQTRVARAVGIPQGHLTYYFPKKRDLVLGVAERFAETAGTRLLTFFADRRDQAISDVLRDYVTSLTADRGRTRLLMSFLVMSDVEPELKKTFRRAATNLRAILAPVLNRPHDDPLVDLMISMLWGIGIHEFILQADKAEVLVELAISLTENRA